MTWHTGWPRGRDTQSRCRDRKGLGNLLRKCLPSLTASEVQGKRVLLGLALQGCHLFSHTGPSAMLRRPLCVATRSAVTIWMLTIILYKGPRFSFCTGSCKLCSWSQALPDSHSVQCLHFIGLVACQPLFTHFPYISSFNPKTSHVAGIILFSFF